MALLESVAEHRPLFFHPSGNEPQVVRPSVPEKLDYFTLLPLFGDVLEKLIEARPDVASDGKVQKRTVFVKDALINHAEFYEAPAGTIIFQEGSFGEHLIMLLRGAVRTSMNISVDANRQETVMLEDVRPGAFFGEMSVLSMNAHLFSAETLAPSLLLLVPQFIVQELEVSQESFGQQIRQAYWKRACYALLRRVPLLRFSSEQEINQLANEVTTRIFGAGAIIFRENDIADVVHVIHQGFVKLSKEVKGQQKILGYLGEGDGFGEMGVLTGAARSATATAMSKTETIVIPGANLGARQRAP